MLITLAPMVSTPDLSIQDLRNSLAAITRHGIRILEQDWDMTSALDTSRRQYHSTVLLSQLLAKVSAPGEKILGITTYDLFVPVLTFVFGQAQLNNPAGVFSIFRLRSAFYGMPEDPDILFSRAVKEALHELGHTFGLRHCLDAPCAMNASTYVEDIDLKPAAYCNPCLRAVRKG